VKSKLLRNFGETKTMRIIGTGSDDFDNDYRDIFVNAMDFGKIEPKKSKIVRYFTPHWGQFDFPEDMLHKAADQDLLKEMKAYVESTESDIKKNGVVDVPATPHGADIVQDTKGKPVLYFKETGAWVSLEEWKELTRLHEEAMKRYYVKIEKDLQQQLRTRRAAQGVAFYNPGWKYNHIKTGERYGIN
jgi:hypothetical protein